MNGQKEQKQGNIMATTTYFIKKIGVMSVAQFGAVIGMIIGTINGIMPALNIAQSSVITTGVVLGVGSGIMTFALNVIMGIFFGFLGGAVFAIIYNFGLGETGGIGVDLEPGL
jgi:uncharacterized protein YqgC (DUF456 family)